MRAAHAGDPQLVAVDAFDNSVWVVTTHALLVNFDEDGDARAMAVIPGEPSAIGIGVDQSLWAATGNEVMRFDRHAVLLSTRALSSTALIEKLVVDSLHDRLIAQAGDQSGRDQCDGRRDQQDHPHAAFVRSIGGSQCQDNGESAEQDI